MIGPAGDSEALYVGIVRDGLADGTPVATRAPGDAAGPYVRVFRVGGPAPYPFLDRPMLTFECWAPNDGVAAELGARVRAIVWAADGGTFGAATVTGTHETGGLVYFEDPHTADWHRYQFTTRVDVRWRRNL